MKNKKRNFKGEKVYHIKGTFNEVWKEYLKLNQQFKNNYETKTNR